MRQIKTISVLILSLIIAILLSNVAFVSNTPRINTVFIADIKNLPSNLRAWLSNTSPKKKDNQTTPDLVQNVDFNIANIDKMSFQKIRTGVSAADIGVVKIYKFNDSQINWAEIKLTKKSGEVINFRYPKDSPPTDEMLKIIQSE